MEDLLYRGAIELAVLVRRGEVSAVELTEAALRRIEAVDGRVGAFAEVDGDRALADARQLQNGDGRPFAGVPLALKANRASRGRPLHFNSQLLADYRAEYDAFVVRRLQDAGFVIVGVTKLPEFGILPTTEPRFGGPARNPWDLERTPGGSSGGSAAAVAAGMVPLAHGNDGGGSIRIPAACCGLVGLKPSRGRISRGPELGDDFLSTDGVLSRTVADTAAALDVLAGYEVGDATWAARPDQPYTAAVKRDPGRLRVAVTMANPLDAPVDPECERGTRVAAELLASLGHEVEEAAPEMPGLEGLGLFSGAFASNLSLGVGWASMMAGREPGDEDLEPLTHALNDAALAMTARDYLFTLAQLQQLSRGFVAFFADYDLLLTPALAERPVPIGEITGFGEDPMGDFTRSGRFTPYTALLNVTGQPAINVPVALGADGIPTCIQLVGRPLGEERLLQVAAQMETAQPWAEARASV